LNRREDFRMSNRKAIFTLLATAFLFGHALPAPAAETTRDPMQHFFQQGFNNLPDEVAAAKSGGQQGILIMFEAEDCPWCAKMKATVLNQVTVQDYFRKHFRILMMDVNGDVPMTDFSGQEMPQKDFAFKHNRVRATPVFTFFGLDGKLLTKYTGAARDPEEFLWLGEFVVNGAWKTTNFTAYKRERSGTKK
jgi:thioredoxin-related protein